MTIQEHLAQHLRQVHFGGNWTGVDLKSKLEDLPWQQATSRDRSSHSIATLVFHINYYVSAVAKVFEGGPLDAHDRDSFNSPPIRSREAWNALLENTWAEAELLAGLIEQMPENQLWETFVSETYGTYYRNIAGLVEHCHYHLGQIALIRNQIENTRSADD
ncbi:hypothetical protein Mal4_39360 [Maioricimonas rarisocia]|uniref:DinB superfamily protein n=1 Tax=Maioricimonas rarisocia TaxID=2528026 RepID=A0A517ZAY0_9PLAN|nr:DUF664 domain-containing protein [Maioricimonas rarisocia]QDU39590.1 hypothetical protein Mal4_39360 [Maioricimonas rarisocia]